MVAKQYPVILVKTLDLIPKSYCGEFVFSYLFLSSLRFPSVPRDLKDHRDLLVSPDPKDQT